MRKSARRLAWTHWRVNPALVEEISGDLRHSRREPAVCGKHDIARLVPGKLLGRGHRQWGVAIPIVQRIFPEPFGFQFVITMRQTRMRRLDSRDERGHNFAFNAVGQMTRIGDVFETAPTVGNFLVLGQRVRNQREDSQIRGKRIANGLGGFPSYLFASILHQIEYGLDRQLLASDRKTQ